MIKSMINIIFKTDSIEAWRSGIVKHFDKTEVIKHTTSLQVIKVTEMDDQNEEFSVKFNLHSTGSVVIQGPKCREFECKYFKSLKDKVHTVAQQSIVHDNYINSEPESSQDDETSAKSLFNDSEQTITDENDNCVTTSTPITHRKPKANTKLLTPKERLASHHDSFQKS